MFPVMKAKGREYMLKPANCPHHIQIFARKPWSYRDMPQRYAESTTQYRSELSGELEGLARVLSLTLDDSHVFARPGSSARGVQKSTKPKPADAEGFQA